MAAAGIRPGTEGANLLRSMYDAEIKLKTSEEGVIAQDIPKGSTEKIGDTYYVRIVPTVTARTAASTDQMGPEALTYETASTTRVSQTPTRKYFALEFPISMTEALLSPDNAKMRAAYRDQGTYSLIEAQDVLAAQLPLSLTTNVKGPLNADKTNLLAWKSALKVTAKRFAQNGKAIHVKYHTSQSAFVESIAEIMNADARGGGDNPNVSGIMVKAWGMTFADTGNIVFSGGAYQNVMYVEDAFLKAYNFEPKIVREEDTGLVHRMFGYLEVAFVEVFDECALLWKSA